MFFPQGRAVVSKYRDSHNRLGFHRCAAQNSRRIYSPVFSLNQRSNLRADFDSFSVVSVRGFARLFS